MFANNKKNQAVTFCVLANTDEYQTLFMHLIAYSNNLNLINLDELLSDKLSFAQRPDRHAL